jgi:hypothetical protein
VYSRGCRSISTSPPGSSDLSRISCRRVLRLRRDR